MRSIRAVIVASGLALLLGIASAGDAAAAQGTQGARARATPGEIEITTVEIANTDSQRTINVPVGKARLVRLPVSVRDVVVGDANVADIVVKTPQLVYLLGRTVGNTNAFFLGNDGKEVLRLEVKVEVDVVTLKDTIEALMPNDRIDVRAVNQNIFLTGNVRSPAAAETARTIARRFVADDNSIVNLLAVKSEAQVLLRVKVAEVQRTALKELGVSFNGLGSTPGTGPVVPFGSSAAAKGVFGGVLNSIPVTTTTPFGFGQLSYITSALQFNTTLNALERDGFIKTLAEPNLTSVSGESASFLAGGEFPVPVAQQQGTISIVFKQFGIGLNFTPVVLDQGRLSLKVATEVSALSQNGAIVLQSITIPALSVRRAQTTVEMASGGSIVIAGLLQNDINNAVSGYPGLKEIPILGQLFRSQSFQRQETEMVVTVTAYLVRQVEESQIALPTHGFQPASDLDIYLLGRLHAKYSSQSDTSSTPGQLKGPLGYILE